ncbi:MAG TPA: hypothetical protein PLW66_09000, partial [Saprospiraceae bacterium]|nr:hypothetical protein [Saprospiraceae bacterium]
PKTRHNMEKNFWDNLSDTAKAAFEKAGIELGELKNAAGEKWAELSEKAEKLAAEGNAEAKEKLAELKAMREKLDAHEGGALGFLSEKANELLGEAKEELSEAADKGKDFWDKAKDFVSDKVNDVKDAFQKEEPGAETDESKPA